MDLVWDFFSGRKNKTPSCFATNYLVICRGYFLLFFKDQRAVLVVAPLLIGWEEAGGGGWGGGQGQASAVPVSCIACGL